MTKVQGEAAQFHCPRCGGLMEKAAGSSLYWHADRNHPRCEITNIVDTEPAVRIAPESPAEPPATPKPRTRRER